MAATSSFVLGPGHGRWTPGSWQELAEALENGVLNETTWMEIEKDLAPGRPGNLETARDLASLALRSGVLIVGVSEASRGVAGEVCSVELSRVRDGIDQIARNVPSPPIYAETHEIPGPRTARPGSPARRGTGQRTAHGR